MIRDLSILGLNDGYTDDCERRSPVRLDGPLGGKGQK